jgi:hypothetical protein
VTETISVAPDDWVFHPEGDDLAVAGIALHSDYHDYMLVNDYPMFLTQETAEEERIGLGDDVFVVGRLIDQDGRQHDSPTAQFGQIAMMPQEELRMADGHLQTCFLADVQSQGGLTGSPVFVTVQNLRLQNPVQFNHAWSPYLLGVHCGYLKTPPSLAFSKNWNGADSLMTASPQPASPSYQPELMTVIPAWRLAQILNLPRFLQARALEDGRRTVIGTSRYRTAQRVH